MFGVGRDSENLLALRKTEKTLMIDHEEELMRAFMREILDRADAISKERSRGHPNLTTTAEGVELLKKIRELGIQIG